MAMTVGDILGNADAFKRAYPNWPSAEPVPEETSLPLADRLAAWIDEQGIKGNYDTAGIAARIIRAIHPSYITAWLEQGGTAYLRDRCERIRDEADLTDMQRAAENFLHGNGRHPGHIRIGEAVND